MKYSVDSAEVALASERTRASAATMHAEVAAMMGHLVALQGTWTGAASQVFADLAQRWQVQQQQIESVLEQISVALNTAANAYAGAEAESQRLFAG